MITYLILLALTGLLVGALARLLLPGRDPMSIPMTMLLGVAGSATAGLLSYLVFGGRHGGSFVLSVLFATLFVYLVRRSRGKGGQGSGLHRGSGTGHRRFGH